MKEIAVEAYDPLAIPRWTHDDNMAVQPEGWAIQPIMTSLQIGVGRELLWDLLWLGQPYSGTKNLMQRLVVDAEKDPFIAKAVAFLTAQRLLHPNYEFNFLK